MALIVGVYAVATTFTTNAALACLPLQALSRTTWLDHFLYETCRGRIDDDKPSTATYRWRIPCWLWRGGFLTTPATCTYKLDIHER